MKRVQFTKVRNVKNPIKAYGDAAGTDFFVPEYSEDFLTDLFNKNAKNNIKIDKENITIPAGEQVLIPAGIKVNILDKNTYLEFKNKSGVASKKHLSVMACVIDADYLGEVHINLANVGNTEIKIEYGEKIIQAIQKEYIRTEWIEITNEEFSNLSSERGEGGFGSSGIK